MASPPRAHPVPLAPEDLLDLQVLMGLKVLRVELETLEPWARR